MNLKKHVASKVGIGLLACLAFSALSRAQTPDYQYTELPNPTRTDAAAWQQVQGTVCSWGTTDVRYKKEVPFTGKSASLLTLQAWRGERVSCQFVVSTDTPINQLQFSVSNLRSAKGTEISTAEALKGFVRYVMTDGLNKDGRGGCGARPDASQWDSSLVADPIDHLATALPMPARTTQAGWIGIDIPQTATPGHYTGTVTVTRNGQPLKTLKLDVEVGRRTLPTPDEQQFHLDLWQNPYAIARFHHVEPWSPAHMEAMRPYMQLYRQAGGRSITCSIMHLPWNGQTYDPFLSMITWMKLADGTWSFDFAVFDRWVTFMKDLGMKGNIYCYSMVPWKLSFRYFDQQADDFRYIDMQPGTEQYARVWGTMLKAFAAHLKTKGWFDHTYIAMDERPMEVMKQTIEVIRDADPAFHISLAGTLHQELSADLNDYSVALREKYSEPMKTERHKAGRITTIYTCCTEPYPNTFTFSPPAESEFLGWYVAREHLDGYLRWALNSWVKDPLVDSRFNNWAAGDCYLIYPSARTCIRFERLRAGIQAWEKVRILRQEFRHAPAKLKKLENILRTFDEKVIPDKPAAATVNAARQAINNL